MKTDNELRTEVIDELDWEPRINTAEIGVSVKDSVVTLTGYVNNYSEKWNAEVAAKRVFGVKAVANEIEVKLPSSSERTDPDIARAALDTLKWNVSVPHDHIKVIISKGWVKLEGEVEWEYQKREAERVVRQLLGVKGVSNRITIKSRVSPVEIKSRIEAALKRSAEIDAQHIKVEAQDGTVILRGNVRSWAEREEAELAAWAAHVSKVDNRIEIEY